MRGHMLNPARLWGFSPLLQALARQPFIFLWRLAPTLEKVILSSNKVVTVQHPSLTCDSSAATVWTQGLLNSDSSTAWEDWVTSPHHCTGYPDVKETLSENFGLVWKNTWIFSGSLKQVSGVWAQSKCHFLHKGLSEKQSPKLYFLLHLHFLLLYIVHSTLNSIWKESPITQMFLNILIFLCLVSV